MKLGIKSSEATVSKYLPRRRKPLSQTWRAFLDNHVDTLVSVDFFTVPTVFFHVFVFVMLAHDPSTTEALRRWLKKYRPKAKLDDYMFADESVEPVDTNKLAENTCPLSS